MPDTLLIPGTDPLPAVREEGAGFSPFLMISEHAGKAVPAVLGDMGVSSSDWSRHIAVDIGAKGMARTAAAHLGATLIHQRYSRLVIDCNRTATAKSLIPTTSDGATVPGNQALSDSERAARIQEIHTPFHAMIADELALRKVSSLPTLLVSIHSFTPMFGGAKRPMHVGVQYAADNPLARAVLETFRRDTDKITADNEPYPPHPTDDYSMPLHGAGNGLPHVMLEIRQDLVGTPDQQTLWGQKIAQILRTVHDEQGSNLFRPQGRDT